MFGIWTTYWCQNYLYFKSVLNFAHKWVPAEKWGEISEVKGSQRPSCLNWNKKSPESGNWPTSNMSGNTTRTVLRVQYSAVKPPFQVCPSIWRLPYTPQLLKLYYHRTVHLNCFQNYNESSRTLMGLTIVEFHSGWENLPWTTGADVNRGRVCQGSALSLCP